MARTPPPTAADAVGSEELSVCGTRANDMDAAASPPSLTTPPLPFVSPLGATESPPETSPLSRPSHLGPLIASAALAVALTVLCAIPWSPYSPIKASNQALRDTGFLLLPDWTNVAWLNTILSVGHGAYLAGLLLQHACRWVVLRRTMFLFGVGQTLMTVQLVVTWFPAPTSAPRTRWPIAPVLYTLTVAVTNFYTTRRRWYIRLAVVTTATLSMLVCIATRELYTVDVFSGIVSVTAMSIAYHWKVRTPQTMSPETSGGLLYWFERDAISALSPMALHYEVGAHQLVHAEGQGSQPHHDGEGVSSSQRTAPHSHHHSAGSTSSVGVAAGPSSDVIGLFQITDREDLTAFALFRTSKALQLLLYDAAPASPERSSRRMQAALATTAAASRSPSHKEEQSAVASAGSDVIVVPMAAAGDHTPTEQHIVTTRPVASLPGSRSATPATVVAPMDPPVDRLNPFSGTISFPDAESRDIVLLAAANHITFYLKEKFPQIWMQRALVGGVLSLCLAAGVGAGSINLISVHTTDEYRPIGHELAPDIGHTLLPDAPPWTADVMLYSLVAVVGLFIISLRGTGITVLRRACIEYALSMCVRSVTLVMTFPPDPSPYCQTPTHPKGTTCGDLIFSGHTIAFLLCAFVIHGHAKKWWPRAITTSYVLTGLVAVVMSKLHYTRDVVTAVVVVVTVHYFLNVWVYRRPDVVLRWRPLIWLEADNYLHDAPFADGNLAHREGEARREE